MCYFQFLLLSIAKNTRCYIFENCKHKKTLKGRKKNADGWGSWAWHSSELSGLSFCLTYLSILLSTVEASNLEMLANTNRKKRNPKKRLPFLSENQERAVQKREKFYTIISLLPANTTENPVAYPTPASRLTAPAGCERSPVPLRGDVKAGWV